MTVLQREQTEDLQNIPRRYKPNGRRSNEQTDGGVTNRTDDGVTNITDGGVTNPTDGGVTNITDGGVIHFRP